MPFSVPITRRTFLAGATAAAAASAQQPKDQLYLYGAESFVTSVPDAPFVVGLLLTHRPKEHIQAIHQIKQRTGYRGTFRYRSSDRGKISFARELLHYFVHLPDAAELRFFAAIVTPNRPLRGVEMDAYRVAQYPRLFQAANLPHDGTLRLNSYPREYGDIKRPPEETHALRVRALDKLIANSEAIPKAANDGLIELNSLLCGNLLNEVCNRSGAIQSSARVKLEIVARHRQLLGGELTRPKGPRWQPIKLEPV